MSMTENQERSEYIAGLRAFADALEAAPDVPVPDTGKDWSPLTWILGTESEEEQKRQAAAIVKALGGAWDKSAPSDYMYITRPFAGLHVQITVDREAVCQRVVTGTEEITRLVPAPDAPMVEVTETIETVEWICEPILAGVTA